MPSVAAFDPLQRALLEKRRDGAPGGVRRRLVAEGEGWRVLEVVCTAGPDDADFEERRGWASVSVVADGAFTYRDRNGAVLMTPGALLLGEADQCFTCGHEHGEGDRCISFQLAPELLEDVARECGARRAGFSGPRLAPSRKTARLVVRALAARDEEAEEMTLALAASVLVLEGGAAPARVSAKDLARASEAARDMAACPEDGHSTADLASRAGVSPFRFLRAFTAVVGVSPHQFLLRVRLRRAALALRTTSDAVTDIAYGVGFGDLSNFTNAFKAEFGASPRAWRKAVSK